MSYGSMHVSFRLLLSALIALVLIVPQPLRAAPPPVEVSIQGFLDAQPGALKSFREDKYTAAELIQAAAAYYNLSVRILLALLEATNGLLSTSNPPDQALRQPFGALGP